MNTPPSNTTASSRSSNRKIALLSHRGGNIGHDFMAAGMTTILEHTFDDSCDIVHFEQHRHFEIYPDTHWLRKLNDVPHGERRLLRKLLAKKFARNHLYKQTLPLDFDIAIACGGPAIVNNGATSPELQLMLLHLNGAFRHKGVPVVDAGVGSCFPLERQPWKITRAADKAFYLEAARIPTTVICRDVVTQAQFTEFGVGSHLLPCAAFACGPAIAPDAQPSDGKKILINYLPQGANEDWGQGVDQDAFRQTIERTIKRLQADGFDVSLLCQGPQERSAAENLQVDIPRLTPMTVPEYGACIEGTAAAIVCRVHAAIPLASLGIPSILIGTDTRTKAVELIGLPTKYVKEATDDWLWDTLHDLLATRDSHRERLIDLRDSTIENYADLFRQTMNTQAAN